jgi:tRNA threonylcarbamoyladenosine biosynthesis protein TsaE
MADKIISTSEAQTQELGKETLEEYYDYLKEGAILFALEGDLGAGKTVFAKGVGEFLDIKRPIRSPGYVLVTEYTFDHEGVSGKLYHIDLWRVEDSSETQSLGLRDLIKPGNILIIEWAQRTPELIDELCKTPKLKCVKVEFDHKEESKREVSYGQIK